MNSHSKSRCLIILVSLVSIAAWGVKARAYVLVRAFTNGVMHPENQSSSRSQLFNYADVATTTKLTWTYARSHSLVHEYQQPTRTRSASGISVYKTDSPSVVLVIVGHVQDGKVTDEVIGAGVIVNSQGYILTNWHVIAGYDGAVIFLKPKGAAEASNPSSYIAVVVSQDAVADLALLKMTNPPSDLRAVPLGNMSEIQVAEDIHVIGHPHGLLWSYSTGVISQIRADYSWTYEDGSKHEADVLQMQTAINPGNSGGPVLDSDGRLLGLVAMSEEGQNLDYAVAADVIQKFITKAMLTAAR